MEATLKVDNGSLADGSGMLVPHEHLSLGGMELLHIVNAITSAKCFFTTRRIRLLRSEFAEIKRK